MIIGVVARSPAPPAGPPCCGLGGLLCGLPRVGGPLRLPRLEDRCLSRLLVVRLSLGSLLYIGLRTTVSARCHPGV